jgi:hypothetical protein
MYDGINAVTSATSDWVARGTRSSSGKVCVEYVLTGGCRYKASVPCIVARPYAPNLESSYRDYWVADKERLVAYTRVGGTL